MAQNSLCFDCVRYTRDKIRAFAGLAAGLLEASENAIDSRERTIMLNASRRYLKYITETPDEEYICQCRVK